MQGNKGVEHLLVVDDDPFIRHALPDLLRAWFPALKVHVAAGPTEAENALRSLPAASVAVLSDYNLQHPVTGAELLRRVGRTRPGSRRILFSGHQVHEMPDLQPDDADAFVEKPFRLEDLEAPLRAQLAGAGPRRPERPRAAHLGNAEVVQALVQAEHKGEAGRAGLLYDEAARRGEREAMLQQVRDTFAWQNRVLELVATRAPLARTLEAVASAVETRVAGHVAVMRLDTASHALRLQAGSGLPAALQQVLQGLVLDSPDAPCAHAAREGRRIVADDVQDAARWPGIAAACRQAGIVACWSSPILALDGRVHGSLAVYRTVAAPPTEADLQLLDHATKLARMAIEADEDRAAVHATEGGRSAILEAALDAIVSMDHRGIVTEWNPAATRLFGYAREEAVGRTMGELIVPEKYRKAHWAGLRRYLQTGEAHVLGRPIEITAVDRQGLEFPVELGIVALPTQPPSFTGFIRNMAPEHARREELRATNERLRAVFNQVGVGVAQFRLDGHFIVVNQRYCEIVGRDAATLEGMTFLDVTHPEDIGKDQALLQTVLATGAPGLTESRFRRGDGTTVWVRRSMSLVRNAQGQPELVVGIIQEITDQKRLEGELRELNTTLEQRVRERTQQLTDANRALESFAAAVSHDLRAPLRAANFYIQSALRSGEPAQATEHLQQALRATTNMGQQVEGLLALAQVERGLEFSDVDLSLLAQQAIAELRVAEPQRQVEADIEPGLVVRGDEGLLRSAVQNLLSNAWKFSSNRRVAHIALRRDPDGTFRVRDDGQGFPMEQAPRLFQPFQRVGGPDAPGGLGLGLATVRRIVERHGGSVAIQSEPGKGTEVRFSIPTNGA